jgi:hypothetical protein
LIALFRQTILIPPELDQSEGRDRLELCLLHELAHAETGDARIRLLGSLVQAIWFFLPPFWWLRAQSRLDQEFLADRQAALAMGRPSDYASSLIDFASTRRWRQSFVAGTSPRREHHFSPLFLRVLMLLRCPFRVEQAPPLFWRLVVPIGMIAATLAVSMISVRPPFSSAAAAVPIENRFRMTSLELRASPPGPLGRAPVFELPIILPKTFDLSVDLWADLPTLGQMRVVGLTLESAEAGTDADFAPADWHLVRVRRNHDGVTLWIDGTVSPIANGNEPDLLTTWLSVEAAPGRSGYFQRLELAW